MRKWLVEIRDKNNLTQNEVAVASEIDRAYYNMIENGKRRPSPEVAQRIGSTLKFDWTIFFTNESNVSTHTKEVAK